MQHRAFQTWHSFRSWKWWNASPCISWLDCTSACGGQCCILWLIEGPSFVVLEPFWCRNDKFCIFMLRCHYDSPLFLLPLHPPCVYPLLFNWITGCGSLHLPWVHCSVLGSVRHILTKPCSIKTQLVGSRHSPDVHLYWSHAQQEHQWLMKIDKPMLMMDISRSPSTLPHSVGHVAS